MILKYISSQLIIIVLLKLPTLVICNEENLKQFNTMDEVTTYARKYCMDKLCDDVLVKDKDTKKPYNRVQIVVKDSDVEEDDGDGDDINKLSRTKSKSSHEEKSTHSNRNKEYGNKLTRSESNSKLSHVDTSKKASNVDNHGNDAYKLTIDSHNKKGISGHGKNGYSSDTDDASTREESNFDDSDDGYTSDSTGHGTNGKVGNGRHGNGGLGIGGFGSGGAGAGAGIGRFGTGLRYKLLRPLNFQRKLTKRTINVFDTFNDLTKEKFDGLSNSFKNAQKRLDDKVRRSSKARLLVPLIQKVNAFGSLVDSANNKIVHGTHGVLHKGYGLSRAGLQTYIKPLFKDIEKSQLKHEQDQTHLDPMPDVSEDSDSS